MTASVEAHERQRLEADHSPEQIAGEAARRGIECVSHERIYQSVWTDKKRGGRLHRHLRTKGKRYARRGRLKGKRGQIVGRVDIVQRPAVVEQKQRLGDVEMDLVVGRGQSGALPTINDRASGMLRMAYVESKEAAHHHRVSQELAVDCYFAKPYPSWERGANENLNGLVRQYFPKWTSFERITQQKVDEVVEILNRRPRKRFGYRSPDEVFKDALKNEGCVAFIT